MACFTINLPGNCLVHVRQFLHLCLRPLKLTFDGSCVTSNSFKSSNVTVKLVTRPSCISSYVCVSSSLEFCQGSIIVAESKIGECVFLQDGKELLFGANVSQSRAIEELQKPSQPGAFHRMADHLLRIAGMAPRLLAPSPACTP